MTEKSLMDRWSLMMTVAPQVADSTSENSWLDNSNNALSTEKKLCAIKISDGVLCSEYRLIAANKKKTSCKLQKWIERCKWRLPQAIILFSVLQLFFHMIGPMDLAYQTLAFSPVRKYELWRFFTYSLLHAGTAHLVINLILQLVIALPLESEVGSRRVVFVYVGGILSGSLAASISPNFSLMVGASSGIYSLLMSHVSHIYLNFSTISHRTLRMIIVAVLTISDVVYTLIHCLEHREPQIAIYSHVAGAFSGVLLGFIFYENRWDENRDGDVKHKILKVTSIACFFLFVTLVIIINVV